MNPGGARAEAFERLGGRFDVRVLEPSPPSVAEAPWFADDPVAGGEVVPVERPGTRSWDQLCRDGDDPGLAVWCADRWLGAWRPLQPLPEAFGATRESLHAVAEHVVAPARHAATGKIGLRYTAHGFGTPFFGRDRQVRVQDEELVVLDGTRPPARQAISSLRAAAALAGVEPGVGTGVYEPVTDADPDQVLIVDRDAARVLGDWYGFCASALEQLRSEATDASRVQLWPEHFDLAVDLGDEAAGRRANYGGSPGDGLIPEPYLYVGPWQPPDRSEGFWNQPFGAALTYTELLASDDQRQAALAFLRRGRDLLGG